MPSISYIIASFSVLILSLSFHEAAHAWTASRLGDPTARQLGRLTLNPLAHIDWIGTVLFPLIAIISHVPVIGWAKPVPVNPTYFREPRRDFAIVALAGPASNLLLAVVGAVCLFVVSRFSTADGSITAGVLLMVVYLNVLLAVFNCVPIPPLDGGNMALGLLPRDLAVQYARIRPYGFIVLYVLMFSGILSRVMMPIEQTITGWLLAWIP